MKIKLLSASTVVRNFLATKLTGFVFAEVVFIVHTAKG